MINGSTYVSPGSLTGEMFASNDDGAAGPDRNNHDNDNDHDNHDYVKHWEPTIHQKNKKLI